MCVCVCVCIRACVRACICSVCGYVCMAAMSIPYLLTTVYLEILAVLKFGDLPEIWPNYWLNLNLGVCLNVL